MLFRQAHMSENTKNLYKLNLFEIKHETEAECNTPLNTKTSNHIHAHLYIIYSPFYRHNINFWGLVSCSGILPLALS